MNNLTKDRSSERGSAGIKVLLVIMVLALVFNAGIHYVPVAYNGASFKQEMDTAVVKALGAPATITPLNVAKAHIQKAATDYQLPADAFIDVKSSGTGGTVTAHVAYNQKVDILPFGLYKYDYKFNYVAVPQGFLLKQ